MQKKIPRRAKNVTFLEHLYFTRQRQVNISTTKVLGFHIYPEIKCYIPFQSRNDTNLICTILVFSSCARIVVDLEKIAPGENPFVPQHKEGYYSHHFIPDILLCRTTFKFEYKENKTILHIRGIILQYILFSKSFLCFILLFCSVEILLYIRLII